MIQSTHARPKDFGAFRESLFQHFESLSPHLKRIAEFALGEPNRFAFQTVAEVASEARVQPSTLIRFAKVFGFSGYSELQQIFRLRLIEAERSFRDGTRDCHDRIDQGAAGNDAAEILNAMAAASVLAIDHLKANIDTETLRQAVRLMESARTVYLIGRGRAVPVTTCLAYGLIELRSRCVMLDSVAGMAAQQVASMGSGDLLIAAGFAAESTPLVEAVSTAHARQVPVMAITDSMASPLARHSRVCFVIRDAEFHRFPSVAAHIVLAQSLVIALRYRRRQKKQGAPATPANFDH